MKYVKLNESGVWHIDTKTICVLCGRSMGYLNDNPGPGDFYDFRRRPYAAEAKEPDGPVCKTCLKAQAAQARRT